MQRHRPFRRRSVRLAAAALTALLACSLSTGSAGAESSRDRHGPRGSVTVLRAGLNSPKGIDSALGIPVVSQGAFGPPGPVLALVPGRRGATAVELSSPIGLVDVAVAPDLSVWGLGSDLVLYRKSAFGKDFEPVADIPAYQATDPDPHNVEGEATESNPYGIAVLPGGDVLVADAANNDLLRVTRRGAIRTVARFGPQVVSTDHLPASEEEPLPPEMLTEAVPTSIAVTPHGVLVGELTGFPFRPGSSRVWKVDPNATGADCVTSPAPAARGHRPACSVHADGLTSIQDLAYDAKKAKLYVYELAEGGTLAFEAGFETGEFPPAVLLEIAKSGTRRELAAGKLSQPGGIEVSASGQLLATDGVFGDGRVVSVRR